MRINYKFHATAIAIISLVIVVIFMFFGPKAPAPNANASLTPADSYVRVVSASWGKNCNPFIESAMAARAKEGLERDQDGKVIPRPALEKIVPDNVLARVKELCGRNTTCQLFANSETLGIEPSTDCFKQLELSYRCFEVDRLRSTKANQGDPLTIDCTNPTGSHAPTDTQ